MNLLTDKVSKMYYRFLASAIGSTVVMTIYTTVDLMCVGHYAGPVGSAAISYINPLWSIMISPGVLTGVGGSVMLANRFGAGNDREGKEYFTLATLLTLCFSVVIALSFILFPANLLSFFGAEGESLAHGVAYMRSVALVSPTFTMCACLSSFQRNSGDAVTPTVATIAGGITNMILDVLFVFDFGLGLGTAGAGIATSIGQLVAFSIILSRFFFKNSKIRFVIPKEPFKKIGKILVVGLAAFVLDMSFGVTTAAYNLAITDRLGETEVAVYGAIACVLSMYYCIMNAAGVALQPIAAANFGAGKKDRARSALVLGIVCVGIMGVLFFALSMLFPGEILKIYMKVNDDVMKIGPEITRIYCLGVIIAGFSIVSSYYLQSVLQQNKSLIISLLRGMILPVILLFVLPLAFGADSVWWSIPIAEAITLIVSAIFMLTDYRSRGKENIN
jgi:putative MATE family efflux protein